MTDTDSTGREPARVAIACQGGGSHTAFTAGVLKGLLPELEPDYELVGLSGTSGGAVSAFAAWNGLCTGGPDAARERLEAVWADIAARSPFEAAANAWLQWETRLRAQGAPLPEVSPYDLPSAAIGQRQLRRVIERNIEVNRCRRLLEREDTPELVVGAVDVNSGRFETFVDGEITADAVLASAAIPTLFRAVEIDGHYHWDGLFSQNPPVRDLMRDQHPDELWVIQINPQTRAGEPRTVEEIADRRNELAGNISLNQELRFVEQVNEWIEDGYLPEERFVHTDIRRISLGERLGYPSKLDRSPAFLDRLIERGEREARAFLDSLLDPSN
ncbi:MAG: patatin-like phospholipase family protein [Halalkalicoccus sp.]